MQVTHKLIPGVVLTVVSKGEFFTIAVEGASFRVVDYNEAFTPYRYPHCGDTVKWLPDDGLIGKDAKKRVLMYKSLNTGDWIVQCGDTPEDFYTLTPEQVMERLED